MSACAKVIISSGGSMRQDKRKIWVGFCWLILLMSAQALGNPKAVSERTRAEMAHELQFYAQDLLDELIYQWAKNPPLPEASRVVVMGINVPIGLNSQLSIMLEDHLFELLLKNPKTGLKPVHCVACSALVTRTSESGTVIGRGTQILPLTQLMPPQNADLALYLDIEAEGSKLVLRARLVQLTKDLPIVAVKGLTTSTANAPLLRDPANLKSAEEVKKDYLDVLSRRFALTFPVRIATSLFLGAESDDPEIVAIPPLIWLKLGAETSTTRDDLWTGGLHIGISSLPKSHDAWSFSGRLSRLLTNEVRSLSRPDLYFFLEAGYLEMVGPSAIIFKSNQQLTPGEIIAKDKKEKTDPKASETFVRFGFESRIKEFYRFGIFAEGYLNQQKNKNLKNSNGIQAYGFEFGFAL